MKFIVMFLFGFADLVYACPDFPKPVKLSGTSYSKASITAGFRGPMGPVLTIDGGNVFIDEESDKLCLEVSGEKNCYSILDNLEITDDDTGKVTGVVQKSGKDIFVWSVNSDEKIDKQRPYLKMYSVKKPGQEKNNVEMTMKIDAFDRIGNQVGEFSKTGKMIYSPETKEYKLAPTGLRGLTVPKGDSDMSDLKGNSIVGGLCGSSTTVRPYGSTRTDSAGSTPVGPANSGQKK